MTGNNGHQVADTITFVEQRAQAGDPIAIEILRLYHGNKLGQVQEQPRRFEVFTAADALKPHPPTPAIVPGLILERSVNMFYGEPGKGKTFAMLSLGACVAGGLSWLGYETKQAPVLFVDEESGRYRLEKRLGAILRGEGLGEGTPFSYVTLNNIRLNDPDDMLVLRTLIQERGAKLVIIDALASTTDGDENSKEVMQPIMNALRNLADQTGAAVVAIHHTNKAGGYRGSSAIKGALDTLVLIKPRENSKNVLDYVCEKNRDADESTWSSISTFLGWDTPEETFTLRPYSPAEQPERQVSKSVSYVLDLIRSQQPISTPAIKELASEEALYGPDAITKAVQTARENGLIYRTNPNETGRGVAALWAIQEGEDDE